MEDNMQSFLFKNKLRFQYMLVYHIILIEILINFSLSYHLMKIFNTYMQVYFHQVLLFVAFGNGTKIIQIYASVMLPTIILFNKMDGSTFVWKIW